MAETKTIKAPKGYHFMKSKSGLKLMKHKGKFVPHKGGSLTVKLPIQKRHGSS
jgi:hypothetical protein|tara:strand:+ start:291 stop:449 length:159 start_codon:yes stop_codon:yes gene_type:complete